jgi:hypothetical protein
LHATRTQSVCTRNGSRGIEATSADEGEVKMFKEDSILNDRIRRAIRQRAQRALSKDDLVRAVFDSFRSQQIELRNVSLDDMKTALVEAARAAREEKALSA